MSIHEKRRKCFEEHFQPHDGIEWCDRFGYHPKSTRIPSEFVALAGVAAMANGQLEAWNAALDHDESVLSLIEQNRELLEALKTARTYVYMESRKAALAGFPHNYLPEDQDLHQVDAAIRKATGEE